MSPLPAQACGQPASTSIAAAFDLAANAELPQPYPQIPTSTGVDTIPPSVLKAVGWVESGWRQYTGAGRPLLSFDFGYGIMQITSGMAGAFGSVSGSLDPDVQSRIASDYTYNIAFGAVMLAEKWASTPRIGDGDPAVVENWYYALWAYNGWGWVNNPNNPRYSRTGTPATNPTGFPYQERVLYLVAHPPKDADGNPMWQPIAVTVPSPKTIGSRPGPLSPLAHQHRQPPPALSAVYRPGQLYPVMPGSQSVVTVHVTNTGTQPWMTSGPNAVSLSYHLLTMAADPFGGLSPFSNGVVAFGQGATPLQHVALPGNTASLRMTVQAPPSIGTYQLVWDLQTGAGAWFSQVGGFPRVELMRVTRGASATATPTTPPITTQSPTENLRFVADTSVPDGSSLSARQTFRKGWLVFNDGKTAWNANVSLKLVSGNSFGSRSIAVPNTPPCHTANIVRSLTAPAKAGRYVSVWQMTDQTGHRFGDSLTLVVRVRGAGATPTPGPSPTATPPPHPNPGPTPTPTPAG